MLHEEKKQSERLQSDIQLIHGDLTVTSENNKQLVLNIEQLNAHLLKIEAAKNDEITQLRTSLSQSEEVCQQLNGQLQAVQLQIDDFKRQVSINDHQSISNQHQLHNRIQQQENAIHILVEEKGELLGKIKAMEEIEVRGSLEIENKAQEAKQLEDNLSRVRTELKTFKDYFDQNEVQKSELDDKLKSAQQVHVFQCGQYSSC